MRSITIKRRKSFVACLAKIEIYIEDPQSNDFLINNTPCRKIGDLKNGEEKSFPITEEAVKLFIIADKSSKNYCKTYFQLASGSEDIFLSGKCILEVANSFWCDEQDTKYISICQNPPQKRPLILTVAIIAITSPISMFIFTLMWAWLLCFGIFIGLLGFSELPGWSLCLCLLPFSFSPLFDIFGIILGLVKIKERYSVWCIISSILGLLINFALIFSMYCMGSLY